MTLQDDRLDAEFGKLANMLRPDEDCVLVAINGQGPGTSLGAFRVGNPFEQIVPI